MTLVSTWTRALSLGVHLPRSPDAGAPRKSQGGFVGEICEDHGGGISKPLPQAPPSGVGVLALQVCQRLASAQPGVDSTQAVSVDSGAHFPGLS